MTFRATHKRATPQGARRLSKAPTFRTKIAGPDVLIFAPPAMTARGRLDRFAEPAANDRNLRIGVIHCVVLARQQSPKRVPAQVPGWALTLEVRLPKLPELPNLPSLVVSNK